MKILIIGGGGMLGHQLFLHLQKKHEVKVTLRQNHDRYDIFNADNSFSCVDVRDDLLITQVLSDYCPDVIVNCVGIIKQKKEGKDPIVCLEVNSLFPHRLAKISEDIGSRLIHLSTDCVFSGKIGFYSELDIPDPLDLYGRSKLLGEVDYGNALTIRTSMIGPELFGRNGLLGWFFSQEGKEIKGFTKAIFSGFTTFELSRIIQKSIEDWKDLCGLWHISSVPISKYDLLSLIKEECNFNVNIIPDNDFVCDRSLDSSAFTEKTGFKSSTWKEMIEELSTKIFGEVQ